MFFTLPTSQRPNVQDLLHGCAGASSAAEVARRVAAGAKVNLEVPGIAMRAGS